MAKVIITGQGLFGPPGEKEIESYHRVTRQQFQGTAACIAWIN